MITTSAKDQLVRFEFDNGKVVNFCFVDGCAIVYGDNTEDEKMCVDSFVDYLHAVANSK